MKKLFKILVFFLFASFFLACGSMRKMSNLAKCEFRNKEIDKLSLANINVLDVKSLSDLSLIDVARLGKVFKNGTLPLEVNFQIEVRNPNQAMAAVNKIEWVLEIDEQEMTNGTTNRRIEVPPGQTTSFPLGMSLDLRKILSKESKASLLNFAMNLVGKGEEDSRIRLKIKPFFRILGVQVGYPGYIKLKKTFGGGGKIE